MLAGLSNFVHRRASNLDRPGGAVNRTNEAMLSERLQDLLIEIARRLGSSGAALAEQTGAAMTEDATATWVDVNVPDGVAKGDWSDGPLPISPTVLAPSGDLVGSIHVWVKSGVLSAVEQGWFTDVPPAEWPTPSQLQWP